MLTFQPYSSVMRQNCVDIFRSNVPNFFSDHEIAEYEQYLDRYAQKNYWGAFDNTLLVGAGGIWVRADGVGRLVYGIIQRDLHLKGYGRQLLHFRLKKLAELPDLQVIQLDTSQHNPEFFKRFGFTEIAVTENKYGSGLHSQQMELRLNPVTRRKLLELS